MGQSRKNPSETETIRSLTQEAICVSQKIQKSHLSCYNIFTSHILEKIFYRKN